MDYTLDYKVGGVTGPCTLHQVYLQGEAQETSGQPPYQFVIFYIFWSPYMFWKALIYFRINFFFYQSRLLQGVPLKSPLLHKIPMTLFRVFGGGWVQSSTFFDFFSFHDYFVFIGLYASLYIGDKETYKKS